MSGARVGFFLVLEGIDGAGTTTQAERLARALEARGEAVHVTREPSRGPIGLFLRQALEKRLRGEDGGAVSLDWAALALLFAADRVDHARREIEPALERGALVISDRYDLSSLIYQSTTSPEGAAALPWLTELNGRVPRPDLTCVLTLDAEVARQRRSARGGAEELFEVDELQRRLAVLYRDAARLRPLDQLRFVEAARSVEEVTDELLRGLDEIRGS